MDNVVPHDSVPREFRTGDGPMEWRQACGLCHGRGYVQETVPLPAGTPVVTADTTTADTAALLDKTTTICPHCWGMAFEPFNDSYKAVWRGFYELRELVKDIAAVEKRQTLVRIRVGITGALEAEV